MPEISIIVPVYNVEHYLNRCVDSILSQSYQNFELILVNDGSSDNSGMICDEYAAKDKRIRVIHKKNGGQSTARNAALDWVFSNSDSNWIHFVDSDDWIHSDMLSSLLNAAVTHNVNIAACGHYDTYGELPDMDLASFSYRECSPEEYYTSRNMNAVMPVAKLYRKSCFAHIRYPVGKIHEDEATSYRILFAEERIVLSDMPMYYYFQNPDGTTKSPWTLKRLDCIDIIQEETEYFRKHGFEKAYKNTAISYAGHLIMHRENLMSSDLPEENKKAYYRKLTHRLRQAMWDYRVIYLQNKEFSLLYEAFPGTVSLLRNVKKWIKKGHHHG